jgi:hypothetical protein
VTVLFTDIVGSSEIAVQLGDERWKVLLEAHHQIVRRALKRHGGRELDTAGDGFFAVFDRQAEAIRCAVEIVDEVRSIGLEVRAGLHVGEAELIAGKVGGVSVHTGARIGATAGPGEVMVSGVLRDLVPGSGIDFTDQGSQQLKGIPEEVRTFAVRAVHGVELTKPLDPEVAAERRSAAAEPPDRRRPALLVGGIAGSAVVIALVAIALWNRDAGSPAAAATTMAPIPPKTLVRIDADTLDDEGRFALSGEPYGVAESAGRVWILEKGLLEEVTIDTGHIDRVGLEPSMCSIAAAADGVYLGNCADHRVYRVTEDDVEAHPFAQLPGFGDFLSIVSSPRGLWVLANQSTPKPEDRLFRLDPTSGDVLEKAVLPGSGNDSFECIEAGGYLWTTNFDDGSILQIGSATLDSVEVEKGSEPNDVASSAHSVWVNDHGTAEIIQFDLFGHVVDRVARRHGVLAGAPDGVWALDLDRLIKIDERSEVTKETVLPYMDGGQSGDPLVVTGGSVWIAVRSEDFEV